MATFREDARTSRSSTPRSSLQRAAIASSSTTPHYRLDQQQTAFVTFLNNVRIFDLCTNFSRLHAYTSFQLGGCQDSRRTPARGGYWGTHRHHLPPSSAKKNTHRKRKRNFDPSSPLPPTSTSRGGAARDLRDSHRAQRHRRQPFF